MDMEMTAPVPAADPKRPSWYRRLYARVEALSSTRYAIAALFVVSVIDASVFPIPPFALLIPMVLAQPKRWWSLALLGTLASLGGGLFGYYLGTLIQSGMTSMFSIDLTAPVNRFGIHSTVGGLLGDNFWILSLLCSILPTPFKVVAIGSGMVKVPLARFMLAAVIGRTVRFFGVAGIMAWSGPQARKWLKM